MDERTTATFHRADYSTYRHASVNLFYHKLHRGRPRRRELIIKYCARRIVLSNWQTRSIARSLCISYYRQACAKRSNADIVFTQWSKNGFLAPINVKFGTRAKFQVYRGRNVGTQPLKLSKFLILVTHLCLRGNSFALFFNEIISICTRL